MTPTARRRATPAVVPAPETPSIFTRIGELAAEQQGSLLAKKIDLLLTEDPGCAVDILMNSGAMRYFSASTTKRWNPPFGSDARPSVARSFARAWTKRSTGGPAAAQAYEALVDSWITSGGRGQHSQASDTGVGYRIGQEIAALDRTVWWRAHAADVPWGQPDPLHDRHVAPLAPLVRAQILSGNDLAAAGPAFVTACAVEFDRGGAELLAALSLAQ